MSFVYDRKKTAIVYRNKEYSYADIIKIAKGYGEYLDINSEERVGVFMENRIEYPCAVLSIFNKKGTSTNLDSGYTPEQLAYVFSDSNPKYLFVSNQTVEVAEEAKKLANSEVTLLNVDTITVDMNKDYGKLEIEELPRDSVAVMLYTSGTTGNPKGVMLTFENLMSNIEGIRDIGLVNDQDRLLAILPFHHVLPLNLSMLMPLYFGCLMVISEELSSEAIRNNLKNYNISILIGVPRIWEMVHKGIMGKIQSSSVAKTLFNICKKLDNRALSKKVFKKVHEGLGGHIRILVSGGAKLDPAIAEDFRAWGLEMLEGYGLTETSPIISFNRPGNVLIGSVGEALPGVEVKIAEDGEVIVRGKNVMKGYYNKPEATAEAIDKDGWFHTGDLGELDGKYLKIIGRKKEMIVLSNGKNINPADIEAQIMGATDIIQEIAVAEYDNHLVAVVLPDFKKLEAKKISNAKEAIKWEVIDKYNVEAPKYRKILDIVVVKEELPKTKLGKLRRFMLKDIIEGKPIEKSQSNKKETKKPEIMESFEFQEIAKFIKTLHDDVDIIPESHLEIDLGLDSLDLVELNSFVENTFGIQIGDEDVLKIKTVENLYNYIKEKDGVFEQKDINWKSIFDEPVSVEMPGSSLVGLQKILTKPFFSTYIKVEKKIDKLTNESPVLFVGNHQSFIDASALTQAIPTDILKNTYFLALDKNFEGAIKENFAKNANIILININKNLKETLKISAHVLKEGKNLLIFPEGARTRDGELQQFKKTFAILSKELNIPVVPFTIQGAYELMPFGKTFPSSGKVKVEFLDKILPESRTIDEIVTETKRVIQENLDKSK